MIHFARGIQFRGERTMDFSAFDTSKLDEYAKRAKEILFSLGQMYAAGGEFTENIDHAGGTGTAEFVANAIRIYCKK